MSLLRLEAVAASYGASQALFGVDLDLAEGEMLALMGRNGMGKTTTIRAVFGLTPPSAGAVRFAGTDITGRQPHRIARLGLGLVPEGRRCFPNLTVRENLLAAARPGRWTVETVGALFPRIAERHAQSARTLSGGEQQMLAIGRALMTNPDLVILDEATEGLAPQIVAEIWRTIAEIRSTGIASLIVDRNYRAVLANTDRAYVMEKGQVVLAGESASLAADLETLHRHLGV
jgi:branched-chain amino acid transport system ATP-binding protein